MRNSSKQKKICSKKMPIGASIGATFIFEHQKKLGIPI